MHSIKKCSECPIVGYENFYKHSGMADGHLSKCKSCVKRRVSNHRIDNIEQIREYDRNRPNQSERNENNKMYAQNNKDKVNLIKKNWINNNQIKRKAHLLVQAAIKNSLLVKQNCEVCAEILSEAHHDDYTKPLEVRWLCDKHHKEWHKKQREILNKE